MKFTGEAAIISITMDRLTLLVFKDNEPSRTFQIRLSWISRLGWTLSAVGLFSLLCLALAIRSYRDAAKASPGRVMDLESEISELRNQLQVAKTMTVTQPSPVSAPSPIPAETLAPPQASIPIPDRSDLKFEVTPAKFKFKNKTLTSRFALQYKHEDGGTQQGHIVLLARGPNTIYSHPADTLSLGESPLVNPTKGEYFSVGRFREVSADFGPIEDISKLRDLEIRIYSLDGQLIFLESVPIKADSESAPKKARGVPPKTATPPAPAPTHELIEPGVDR